MSVFDALEAEINEIVRNSPEELHEAEDLLKQMTLEVRGEVPSKREALTVRLARSKEAVAKLRKETESAQLLVGGGGGKSDSTGPTGSPAFDAMRRFPGCPGPEASGAELGRGLKASTATKISLQNEKILNAQRSVQESESIGEGIIEELGRNRAKIVAATGKAGELQGEIESAEVKVKSMQSRENCVLS